MSNIKFYHASPRRFHYGEIITGGHAGGAGYEHPNVCMTTSPKPHVTIAANIPGWHGYMGHYNDDYDMDAPDWYVYEVQPLSDPKWVPDNDEYQCKAAKVIKNVGSARAFLPQKAPAKRIDKHGYEEDIKSKEWGGAPAYSPNTERQLRDTAAKKAARAASKLRTKEDQDLVGEALLREAIQNVFFEIKMKGLYKQLLLKYKNIPEYVLHDMYRSSDEKFFEQMNRLDWKLQVLEVSFTDFCPETQRMMKERKFGAENPYQIHNDSERMSQQKKLISKSGNNEPIIVIKRVDGYRLYEGWHRTMNVLQFGGHIDNDPENWDPVKIKAWVGSSSKK